MGDCRKSKLVRCVISLSKPEPKRYTSSANLISYRRMRPEASSMAQPEARLLRSVQINRRNTAASAGQPERVA